MAYSPWTRGDTKLEGQSERLALIIPQLMRMTLMLASEPEALQNGGLAELRTMLRNHLEARPSFL